ncbi:MAG: ParA family protein [Magnetococcales bacterium]|nr:ParA family protein [Magnetococcales bacterium]
MSRILFNEALKIAIKQVRTHIHLLPGQPVIVRDLRGRICIALDASEEDESLRQSLSPLAESLSLALGAFACPKKHLFMFQEDLPDPDFFFQSNELIPVRKIEGKTIYLLERQVTGQDWMLPLLEQHQPPGPPRFTFFGLKGGVGRSTALAVWAWHLARKKYKVLVVDLDLESPGVSSMLLPHDRLPRFGVVDWFVESAVNQGTYLLPQMVASSTLPGTNEGWIGVVSAHGSSETDYLAKLSRCYQSQSSDSGVIPWAERLALMLTSLEQQERPDVVLLDSRAGLHDISAVTITRLGATAFLFAINTPQTWMGYCHLFKHWKRHPQLSKFRDRLQLVAGMIPDLEADLYLNELRDDFFNLFSTTLYEKSSNESDPGYNFDFNDDAAPHTPWNIRWQISLQGFDPVNKPTRVAQSILDAAFSEFFERTESLLPPRPSRS